MSYILVGTIGFLSAYIFDWAHLKQLIMLKQFTGSLALVLIVYATIMVCITPTKMNLPLFVLPFGILILIIATFLLIYSLFIEIPFRATYIGEGISNNLVTSGTYALVRHPGVLWLALLYIALILLFPSKTIVIATTVWIILDIIYIVLQDKIFFPRIFPEYASYQKLTPFIIPNRRSISACLQSLRFQKY